MGEIALKRIQAATEVTRGTALAATRRVYGTGTMTRQQSNRYAVEDRGAWTDKFRGNKKLIESGFSLARDVLFEDEPFHISQYLNGGLAPSGTIATGFTYAGVPDVATDSLKTVCLEMGEDAVAWQGPFGATDTVDFTLGLDEALTATQAGFVKDWTPQSSGALTTGFTGFTAALAEHAVESIMGWQCKLYIDPSGTAAGTTQITGRFISSTFGIHNQNKRKFFGDGSATFSKLGRGRRQVHCQVQFEAPDLVQYADFFNNSPKVVRIGAQGTGIVGSTGPVLKSINFDFYGLWDTFTIGARDTNTTFTMDLMAVYDTTAAKELAITVINQNAAI